MIEVLAVALTLGTAPAPFPADTPPPPPAAVLARLASMADVIAASRLESGAPLPAGIILPQLRNVRQVFEYMRVHYPDSLHDVARGTPIAWLLIDERGTVVSSRIVVGSGRAALDTLSLGALGVAWFNPALIEGQPIRVWVPFPARVPPHAQLLQAIAAADKLPSDEPFERKVTQKPVLLNRSQVESAILRIVHSVNRAQAEMNLLFERSQNVGGNADVWIYIDATGTVGNALIKKTTGNRELDAMALQVARLMRFSPARDGDKAVDIWIEAPIKFR